MTNLAEQLLVLVTGDCSAKWIIIRDAVTVLLLRQHQTQRCLLLGAEDDLVLATDNDTWIDISVGSVNPIHYPNNICEFDGQSS